MHMGKRLPTQTTGCKRAALQTAHAAFACQPRKKPPMDEQSETMTISNRSDFAQWAIERAKAIIAEQGGNLAVAARDDDNDQIAEAANALGQSIVDAMLEVFDSLVGED
jgi:uncharacterized protein (DUF1778 family)